MTPSPTKRAIILSNIYKAGKKSPRLKRLLQSNSDSEENDPACNLLKSLKGRKDNSANVKDA